MKLMLFLGAWMFFSLANAQTDSVVYRASSKETATEKKIAAKKILKNIWVTQKLHITSGNFKVTYYDEDY